MPEFGAPRKGLWRLSPLIHRRACQCIWPRRVIVGSDHKALTGCLPERRCSFILMSELNSCESPWSHAQTQRFCEMSHNIRSLDCDTLVRKYTRLSPAVRCFQMSCLAFASYPLGILLIIAITMALEVVFFAISKATMPFPSQVVLDFHVTRSIVVDGLSHPQNFFEALLLCKRAVCGTFVTVSLISLRFSVLAYGAILILWIRFFYVFADLIPTHFHEWQLSGGRGFWGEAQQVQEKRI